MKEYGWAKGSNEVKKLIYILKNDKQDDPVIALSTISLDLSANLNIDLINYNNSFDNRMTFLKDEFNIVRNLPINSTFKQKTTKITNNLKNVQPLIPELEESKIIQDSNTVNNSTLKDTNEEENANLLEKSTDTAVLDEIQIEMKPDIKADEKLDKEENNNSSNEDSVESK